MKTRVFLALVAVVCMTASSIAQSKFSYGFRAGLSYSKFAGPLEMNDAGEELESYKFTNGFHIGVAIDYSVTDQFGFRTELLFNQRGTDYKYEGESYYFLARNSASDERLIIGKRKVDMGVSTATLGLPIFAYYRIGAFEISGGINLSFIMASTGGGSLEFTQGVAPAGSAVDSFNITMRHNYSKDGPTQAGQRTLPIDVDGALIYTSGTTGAYYDYDFKDKNLYRAFDIGLTAGLSFFLNDGLYLGGRVIYGLTDVDRNEYDISYYKLDGNSEYIKRADDNRNLTIQASIGFLF